MFSTFQTCGSYLSVRSCVLPQPQRDIIDYGRKARQARALRRAWRGQTAVPGRRLY